MAPTITITSKDPCPACNGTLKKAPQATPAQRAKAKDRDDPVFLPPHYDTASLDQIAELGELWRCDRCGYPHREKPAPAAKKPVE